MTRKDFYPCQIDKNVLPYHLENLRKLAGFKISED